MAAPDSFEAFKATVKDASPFKDIEFNFRDLHLVNPRIKQGRLFRSGTPSMLNSTQLGILVNDVGIKTIIDLRDLYETTHDPGAQLIHHVFAKAPDVHEVALDKLEASSDFAMFNQQLSELSVTPLTQLEQTSGSKAGKANSARDNDHAVEEVTSPDWQEANEQSTATGELPVVAKESASSQQQVAAALELCNCYGSVNGRLKYFIPLAERSVMTKALISSISWKERLHVAGRYFLGVTWDPAYKREAKDYMLQHFDGMGLLGLNKIILTYSTHVSVWGSVVGCTIGSPRCVCLLFTTLISVLLDALPSLENHCGGPPTTGSVPLLSRQGSHWAFVSSNPSVAAHAA